MATLRYGTNSTVRLEPAGVGPPIECGRPRSRPVADVRAAVAAAVADPLDYPPLARSTTPGDRVVIALGHGVPQAGEVVAAVMDGLVGAGVDPDGIVLLLDPADAASRDTDAAVPGPLRERVKVMAHDPRDRRQLAYLAADDEGQPVLLSRAVHDADLVLPIGCVHGGSSAGYYGIHGAVFPTYSDRRTQQRFRSPGSLEANGDHKLRLVREVDQVAWLLGVTFTIQVVPAAGDAILHVVAGQSQAVGRRVDALYRRAWAGSVPRRASLVVAAIEGNAVQQTWDNFGAALAAASALVEDGGSIAVCCELDGAAGPAIQRLAGATSRDAAMRRIRKDRPPDCLPAAQLARALDRGRVYLLSRLDPSLVEDLEMVCIAAPEELVRLVRRCPSCILLSNASRALVTSD